MFVDGGRVVVVVVVVGGGGWTSFLSLVMCPYIYIENEAPCSCEKEDPVGVQ